jgi:hypothetical protein
MPDPSLVPVDPDLISYLTVAWSAFKEVVGYVLALFGAWLWKRVRVWTKKLNGVMNDSASAAEVEVLSERVQVSDETISLLTDRIRALETGLGVNAGGSE